MLGLKWIYVSKLGPMRMHVYVRLERNRVYIVAVWLSQNSWFLLQLLVGRNPNSNNVNSNTVNTSGDFDGVQI